jgi:tRNA (guanine37-N1)-methyltransferase
MLVVDAVTRLLPGALGNEASSQNESFSGDLLAESQDGASISKCGNSAAPQGPDGLLLDYPHYTRPAEYRGWTVPNVLVGGNHADVAKWRAAAALEKTQRNRPDLLLRR